MGGFWDFVNCFQYKHERKAFAENVLRCVCKEYAKFHQLFCSEAVLKLTWSCFSPLHGSTPCRGQKCSDKHKHCRSADSGQSTHCGPTAKSAHMFPNIPSHCGIVLAFAVACGHSRLLVLLNGFTESSP